ncbi:hypothetical protein PGT21_001111 [Puccinia graminis f. sp. tritici]|uniref:Uncharacterized protein n=1 Tax=Puccinia graminis f. sp. tritici TaxID=56615 RepID=A0A5B0MDM1_PUCGR|nr:hypothetical protein PGT21_001111 [Puccinia graminis f. sp. tritici]
MYNQARHLVHESRGLRLPPSVRFMWFNRPRISKTNIENPSATWGNESLMQLIRDAERVQSTWFLLITCRLLMIMSHHQDKCASLPSMGINVLEV